MDEYVRALRFPYFTFMSPSFYFSNFQNFARANGDGEVVFNFLYNAQTRLPCFSVSDLGVSMTSAACLQYALQALQAASGPPSAHSCMKLQLQIMIGKTTNSAQIDIAAHGYGDPPSAPVHRQSGARHIE